MFVSKRDRHGSRGTSRTRDSGYLFFSAGVLLILVWALYFLELHDPIIIELVYAGWLIDAVGIALIFLSIYYLHMMGRPEGGKDFTHTTVVVSTGVYAVVRHPLYLGWALMYVVAMLFSQHWLVLILGSLGVLCMYALSMHEDGRLLESFGNDYRSYMASVPRMNLVAGIVRHLRRRKEDVQDVPSDLRRRSG
jgi:protein-S-isoprenylcysteine O-methyltransferase Ste14